jgi:CRP-like cAMP-binding protein
MAAILKISLFSSLDPKAAADFERHCVWRNYEPGELIIDYEDATTDVRFILSGKIRVLIRVASGKEVILGDLGAGDYFGEMAAIDKKGRSANVTALEHSRVCIAPADAFMGIVTSHPQLSRIVLEGLVARVRHLNMQLIEQHFLTAAQRLCAELIRLSRPRLARTARTPTPANERVISPPPVQKDIAARIGSSREAVSRELSALERQGLLEKTKGGLVLKDVDVLNRRISTALGDHH